MLVRILGTAAGGGLPQWNCACAGCAGARSAGSQRSQDCLAISGDGVAWYLLNASPDLRAQILAAPELAPGPARRQTPLRGALLTSAELDHTLGLASLREATDFTVYATWPVLQALPLRGVIEPYGGVQWCPLVPAGEVLAGGLLVEPIPLGQKKPRYAANGPPAENWVIAHRVTDERTGGVLIYAPCLADWTPQFATALEGADCLLLDGSFFTDHEMVEQAGSGRTSRQMGHLPISDSLAHRVMYPETRWLYTHLNNTNPALVEGSPEQRVIEAAGAEVAAEGMVLKL